MKEVRKESKELLKGKTLSLFVRRFAYLMPKYISFALWLSLSIMALNLESFTMAMLAFIPAIVAALSDTQFTSSSIYTAKCLVEHEELPKISEALNFGVSKIWRRFAVFSITSIIIYSGMNFYIVPGIILCTILFVANYMVVDEDFDDYGIFAIISESFRLTNGHKMDIFKVQFWLGVKIILNTLLCLFLLCTVIGIIFIPFIFTKMSYYIHVTNYNMYVKLKDGYYEDCDNKEE